MKRKTSFLLATTALSLIILSAASTLHMLPVEAVGVVDQAWDPGPAVGGNAVKYHSPIGQSFTPTLNNLVGVDVNILNEREQDAAEITYSGGDAIDYHSPIGQSFKPSYPLFTGFDVYLMNDATATRAVTMKLRSGTIGGSIIGSKTFSVSASSAWAWIHIDMSSPVPVNPGSLYVIELVESVGGVNWGVNLAGTYPEGNSIVMGVDKPAHDRMFKTFGISDSVTANIRSGAIGGSVVGTSTKSVSVQGFTWTHIDFTQFSITPGSIYVLELVDTYGSLSWAWSSGAGYAGGTSFMMGTPADGDCYFRTYGIPAALDFQITSDPASISVSQGGSGSSTIKVQSLNGFSSAVTLSWSWLGTAPSDVTVDLPTPVTPPADGIGQSTLTVTAEATATTGDYTVTVTGVSGALTHTVDVPVSISAAATATTTSATTTTTTPTTTATTTPTTTTTTSPTATPSPRGCLVATATYGSELSPEVQFLRGFRDQQVLSTFAGSEFMKAFNAWYYSFSPSVASFIANNPTVRSAMKILLYPLVGILHLSASAYAVFNFNPELAVCVAGLVASGLIGIVYFSPMALALLAILRRTRRLNLSMRKVVPLVYIWVASIGFAILSILTLSPVAMMFSSALFVLTTIGLTSLSAALKILQRFP